MAININWIWTFSLIVGVLNFISCVNNSNGIVPAISEIKHLKAELSLEEANNLAQLPLQCIQQPYPYKPGHVLSNASDIGEHTVFHPSFYGCFDWHSAVHAHWSLLYLLKQHPTLKDRNKIINIFDVHFSKENIQREINYFSLNKYTTSFERTYGWAWIFKLYEELMTCTMSEAGIWRTNLKPLVELIRNNYIDYLPKLNYPIRVGEHNNTAFGLNFAYDYAVLINDEVFLSVIESKSKAFYSGDRQCPISWEPSGYDFLSPCLEEASLMSKVLKTDSFKIWKSSFFDHDSILFTTLTPAIVSDRSDGKLVHLDGLNFSRAWNLYLMSHKMDDSSVWRSFGNEHLKFSIDNITDGDYAGEHWLATFALYALKMQAMDQSQ